MVQSTKPLARPAREQPNEVKDAPRTTALLRTLGVEVDRLADRLERDRPATGYRPREPATAHWDTSQVPLKSQGELEAAICDRMIRFEQEHMGRGPRDVHAHLIGDLLVIRLQRVLTVAEQQLAKSHPAEKGRDLLEEVRTHLIETARPLLEALIRQVTGVKVLSLHYDISTVTGEEVVLFTLAESPHHRPPKK